MRLAFLAGTTRPRSCDRHALGLIGYIKIPGDPSHAIEPQFYENRVEEIDGVPTLLVSPMSVPITADNPRGRAYHYNDESRELGDGCVQFIATQRGLSAVIHTDAPQPPPPALLTPDAAHRVGLRCVLSRRRQRRRQPVVESAGGAGRKVCGRSGLALRLAHKK